MHFQWFQRETKFIVDKILNAADGKARGKGPLTLSKTGFVKLLVPEACVLIDSISSSNKIFSKTPHAIEIYVGKNRLLGSCGSSFSKNNDWKNILKSTASHSTTSIEDSDAFIGSDLNRNHIPKDIPKMAQS